MCIYYRVILGPEWCLILKCEIPYNWPGDFIHMQKRYQMDPWLQIISLISQPDDAWMAPAGRPCAREWSVRTQWLLETEASISLCPSGKNTQVWQAVCTRGVDPTYHHS
jgi:hypothetical protein